MTPQFEMRYTKMTELEKVEKLREKANVTFAEAKEALDNTGGDILDALIYLESCGKAVAPSGGGYFSGADMPPQVDSANTGYDGSRNAGNAGSGENFSDLMKKFGAFCLKMFNKGLSNFLEATKGDQHLFSCPVLIVILFILIFPWITIPLFIISLFCGFRYRFSGTDLGRDSVNSVMDGASNVVEDVKRSFVENTNNNKEQ